MKIRDNAFFLLSEDNIVVFLSEDRNIDFSKNVVQVCNQYKDVNKDIISQFSGSVNPVYVFYSVLDGYTVEKVEIGIIIILVAALLFVSRSKILLNSSKLARKIKELGDYDVIVHTLNDQIKEAIYKTGNAIVCKEYILILGIKDTTIIPIKQLDYIFSKPSEKYPDEIIEIRLGFENRVYIVNVYDKIAEHKIIEHIGNNKI